MELEKILEMEQAANKGRREMFRLGTALLFLVEIILFISVRGGEISYALMVAAMIGGYMALNIGANDVANNIGGLQGAHPYWCDLYRGHLRGIRRHHRRRQRGKHHQERNHQLRCHRRPGNLHLADDRSPARRRALAQRRHGGRGPGPTTHSIVGGILGAGVAAGGLGIADRGEVGRIVASRVVSPVLGGMTAAGFLYLIKRTITYQTDMLQAARKMAPILQALMAWAFITYLVMKRLTQVWKLSFGTAVLIGTGFAAITYAITRSRVRSYPPAWRTASKGWTPFSPCP